MCCCHPYNLEPGLLFMTWFFDFLPVLCEFPPLSENLLATLNWAVNKMCMHGVRISSEFTVTLNRGLLKLNE